MTTEIAFTLGLDLGAARDPSAAAIVEHRGQGRTARHRVCYLHRWPLGTGYPKVVSDVAALMARPPMPGQSLALDSTGVGAAVRDMLTQAGIDGHVVPYVITAGHTSGKGTVCKADLIAALQSALGEGRLKVAELPLAPALLRELEGWRVEVGTAGNVRYDIARDGGSHGDLCVAVGLALHHHGRQRRLGLPRFLSFRRHRTPNAKPLRIVLCPRDQIGEVETDPSDVVLLVTAADPGEAAPDPAALPFVPADSLHLTFADLTPGEANHDYYGPVAPYGLPLGQLLLQRQEGAKALWRVLLKKRDPAANVIVIADQGGAADRRALSLALAVCDGLGLPRESTLYNPTDSELTYDRDTKPPNPFVYEVAKQGRAMVIACGD
jgi:hypothetical protein